MDFTSYTLLYVVLIDIFQATTRYTTRASGVPVCFTELVAYGLFMAKHIFNHIHNC